jgi:hypothetical protein
MHVACCMHDKLHACMSSYMHCMRTCQVHVELVRMHVQSRSSCMLSWHAMHCQIIRASGIPNYSLKSNSKFELSKVLNLSYDIHANKLLFRDLSLLLSMPSYTEVSPHSTHLVMQCKGEGGEAVKVLCYNAGVYRSKKTAKVLCYSAGIYQYKEVAYQDSMSSITVLMHDSKKGQLNSRERTASIL